MAEKKKKTTVAKKKAPVKRAAKTKKAVSIDDSKKTLVTKGGLESLKKELDYLENTRRKEIAAKIKEAVSYGDLSENSEYEEAKNEQAFVEGRIIQLTEQIKYAKIIDDKAAKQRLSKQKHVQLGNKVKIRALSGKNAGGTFEYSIVGTTEADPLQGRISNESPVGSALLGNVVGEKVDVKVPVGMVTYEILNIS